MRRTNRSRRRRGASAALRKKHTSPDAPTATSAWLVTDAPAATLAELTNGCGASHGHTVTNPPDAASIACTVSATADGVVAPVRTSTRTIDPAGCRVPVGRESNSRTGATGSKRPVAPGANAPKRSITTSVRTLVKTQNVLFGASGTSAAPPTTEPTSDCTVAVNGRSMPHGYAVTKPFVLRVDGGDVDRDGSRARRHRRCDDDRAPAPERAAGGADVLATVHEPHRLIACRRAGGAIGATTASTGGGTRDPHSEGEAPGAVPPVVATGVGALAVGVGVRRHRRCRVRSRRRSADDREPRRLQAECRAERLTLDLDRSARAGDGDPLGTAAPLATADT